MQLTVACHRTTLLHDVAWEGRSEGLHAVDDEFRSTPLAWVRKVGIAPICGRQTLINSIVWADLAGSAWYTFGLSGQRSPWPDDSS